MTAVPAVLLFPLVLAAFLCLYRIGRGPSAPDRAVGIDILGTLIVDAQFGCVEPDRRDGEGDLRHEDALRVLCPRCRRTLVLQELWGEG